MSFCFVFSSFVWRRYAVGPAVGSNVVSFHLLVRTSAAATAVTAGATGPSLLALGTVRRRRTLSGTDGTKV
jgi:hypothetical protein